MTTIALFAFILGALWIDTEADARLPDPTVAAAVAVPATSVGTEAVSTSDGVVEALTPQMSGALEYVSRRYRVSAQALGPVFRAAQSAARELRLDPLLIVAVIGIESGFNPFSESIQGAQGLMQVIPRFHEDKVPQGAGALPFFDPVINVRVGAQALEQSIRRSGTLEGGLQQFGGAPNDEEQVYAAKVLAERQRLEMAAGRGTSA